MGHRNLGRTGGSPPYTWSVTKGTLPPGLTLSPGGSLSGTPTTAGSFPFTVTATDSAQPPEMQSQPVTMAVNTPTAPIVSPSPPPPAGTVTYPYAGDTFTASGGLPPYSWSVTAGTLPPGLTLDSGGSLSGTPTSASSFSFTVTVTDSAPTPEMNSAPFSISITAPPPPTINAASPPTGTVGTAYSPFTFTASNGYLPLVWSETGALPTGLTLSPAGVLSGTPQQDGIFPVTVNATDALNRGAPGLPVTVRVSLARSAAGFTQTTGSMTIPRSGHSATLLTSGEVLIAGGPNATAELYNPASETFTATGSMTVARSGHTATLLTDAALPNAGKVLIAGPDDTAEVFDPAAGTFSLVGDLLNAFSGSTASLYSDGTVVFAGGSVVETYYVEIDCRDIFRCRERRSAPVSTSFAELFAPESEGFTATGSLVTARDGHTATVLADGTVLVAGGVRHYLTYFDGTDHPAAPILASAELYK